MSRARTFAMLLSGIVLLQVAWSIAIPVFRGPDEIEHVTRASGVSLGEIVARSTPAGAVTVERDIVAAQRDTCLELHADLDPSHCDPVPHPATGARSEPTTTMLSGAARYNPAWYLLVAPASWLLEGADAVRGMRALGALACALVLAWALLLHRGTGVGRRGQVGIMLCLTPAVLFASVVAAPNGLHYSASLLFWVALLSTSTSTQRTWALCAGSAIMALTHTLGIVWVLCAVAVVSVLRGARHLVRIGREIVAVPAAFGLVVAAPIASVLWVAVMRTNDPSGGPDVLADSTKEIPAVAHGAVWVLQLVGTMPFRFGLLWLVVYLLWIAVFATFLWQSARHARRRELRAMGIVVLIAIAVPVVATVLTFDNFGYAWQGRYELPLVFALPLIASAATPGRVHEDRWSAMFLVGTGAAMILAITCLALREGSSPPLASCAAALAALAWWLLCVCARDDQPGPTTSPAR